MSGAEQGGLSCDAVDIGLAGIFIKCVCEAFAFSLVVAISAATKFVELALPVHLEQIPEQCLNALSVCVGWAGRGLRVAVHFAIILKFCIHNFTIHYIHTRGILS